MNKKMLIVIAFHDYQDIEYGTPRKILEESGVEIKVASLDKGQASGFLGGQTTVDLLISEVRPEDFDGIIFVGGQGMVELVNNESFINLAQNFNKAGKITAAICVAPKILALAGILKDKQATSWEGVKEDLVKSGANYLEQLAVRDKNIITGSGPQAAEEFGQTIKQALWE